MTKVQKPPTIKGIEKEFDEKDLEVWGLDYPVAEAIKKLYRKKIKEILKYLGMKGSDIWDGREIENAYHRGYGQAVKKLNLKIKKTGE